jgi:hypothetical protein
MMIVYSPIQRSNTCLELLAGKVSGMIDRIEQSLAIRQIAANA